ncbi:hypothetical protein TrVE_jg2373 [Triparma verrucosa]|uniref:Uncharacterized protein n=2 Tax=Triparma TaxID=722752 RepID=A0A9W7C7X5_9STRA|nr:hypothetical protein TrVE_jg2373 [Triparma verrucosa]GMI00825.1 hypothetical protein TrST_g5035 [Triparma strigata]
MVRNDPLLVNRKIAVLGFRAVGKTSLTTNFVSGTFASGRYDPTIENTYHKTIRFRRVHFATDIIDTAGMDEYSRLSRNASVGVHGYVMVYSINSLQSFKKISQINTTLLNMLGDAPDVPRILVGSMNDLTADRQVTSSQGQELADSWGVPFIECSSKNGDNVRDVFHSLLKEIEKDGDLLGYEGEVGGCHIL